ncbi:fumarylacetoacetate hydrolase family protein [Halobacillus sp. K22]|uniref:fumarylacetoacetate hydrolase family protein n=1 Tax=Halobacillus sp. K22 TaxID=3457431 RepID=UPI003FCD9A38
MKYIRYRKEGTIHYGALEGDTITRLDGNYIEGPVQKLSTGDSLGEVEVLAPTEPRQLLAIGLNYALHAEEQGKPLPEEPMMFMLSPTAVIGQNAGITLPTEDHRIDYEAELAVVIGKEAKDVTKEEALSYVLGYTCGNDISDRDLQKKDIQYTRAKSYATFKPLGPVIETELDPSHTQIKLTLNGEVKQDSNTSDLIHNVEELLAEVTKVMTLQPGDVLMTGTPSGVGPLSPGDELEIEIEGIGKLRNYVNK